MARARVEITVDIEVLSPLHVGSGLHREVNSVRGADGANAPPRVAAIQRDAAGKPWLPGSTIKGLLRRLAVGVLGEAEQEALLGSPAGRDGPNITGRRGALIFLGAALRSPGKAERLPYADRSVKHEPGALGRGVFVAAGTRIDGTSGVAKGSSLRHDEALAPGGVFPLAFTIEARDVDAKKRCNVQLNALLKLLSALREVEGRAIGAGQADGDGRVRLRPETLKVMKSVLDNRGQLVSTQRAVKLPEAKPEPARAPWLLKLHCKGPFAVLDPSWAQERPSGDKTPALKAQRITEEMPVLPGSSVAGALRARATWIAALAARRVGTEPQKDNPEAVYRAIDRLGLTSVQRLFGITGFRGLLEIEELTILKGAKPWQVFSVKLDRFSGGPMSGGLFETAAFIGVSARLVLRLRDHGTGIPTPEDVILAEALIKDICCNGLTLGHGGNKGFGWFTVVEEAAHAN